MYKPSPSHQKFLDIITEKDRPKKVASLMDEYLGDQKEYQKAVDDGFQGTYEEFLRMKSLERKELAIGGGVIQGRDYGTREGFVRPKKSKQKMTVNQALTEIFKSKTNFLNRQELKQLIDKKTGLNVSINILKPTKYPILKEATYRTSELMKKKTLANKKAGKLTKKEAKDQAQIKKQNRINLFKANLGVGIEIDGNNRIIGLEEELDTKLRNASKRFRELKKNTAGISAYDDPNFFKFFENEYRTAEERLKAIAEKYGYTLDEWKELPQNSKDRLYMEEYNNKIRVQRGEVPGGLSIDEIVEQAYEGKKIPGKGPASDVLASVYETLFRQEYDKLAEGGDPFSKSDLSKNVISRIKEMFRRPGQDVPLSLFPANTDQLNSSSAKSYFQYIDPKTQAGSKKNKIFSDYELELFDGNTASSLNKTKTQEKIFNIITEGPAEIDDLSKELDMTPNRIRSEINKLLTNIIVRTTKPAFLKGKEDLFSNLINNLEASKTLDKDWNRSLKYLIYNQIPDPKAQRLAFDRIDEFDSIIKKVQEKFPGVQVNYDHPASYTALKNQNFKQFLNITPIAKDINLLKATFDSRSNQNLLAMNEASKTNNRPIFDEFLNKQIKLEDTWSKLTGGQSSLGKIRLEGVEDFGTSSLDDSKKDLLGEFRNNIKIRKNILKNLTDDVKNDIVEVLPRKDKKTNVLKTLENITNPDLIKQDKELEKLLKQVASKGGAKGKAAVRALQIITAGGVGYKMEDILKGTGLVDKEYELTASVADAPLVEKGLSTGEKVAAGTTAGLGVGTKIGRKALSTLFNLATGPTGMIGLNYAFKPEEGYDLRRAGDRLGFELEAALAPTLVKGVTSVSEKIKNPLVRKGIETLAGVRIPGIMNSTTALKIARAASPVGIGLLAGEGVYKLGKLGYEDQKRFDALSPEEQEAERAEQEAFAFDITGA